MISFDTPGPRRRGGDASAGFGLSGADRSVAFSIPDGFIGGRGGKPFRRRTSSFSCWFSHLAVASPAVSFSFSFRSRSTSPINRRTSPMSSGGLRVSSESVGPDVIPSLNHTFKPLTPPSAAKFAPVTTFSVKLLFLLDLEFGKQPNPRRRASCHSSGRESRQHGGVQSTLSSYP